MYGDNYGSQPPIQMNYGGGYAPYMGGGLGGLGYGNDLTWLILIVLLGGGGWGGLGGWGGMMGGLGMGGIWGVDGLYWLNNSNQINDGFQNQQTNNAVNTLQNAVNSGFNTTQLAISGVDKSICQTGNGITAAMNAGFANAETGANSRQMANMQQLFGLQTTLDGRLDSLAAALAQYCCDNRLGTESLRATVLQENCQDRYEAQRNAADIIASGTANTQRTLDAIRGIYDKLCDQELQEERRENNNLRTQLNMANLAASQTAQTARLLADNAAQTQQIENYVRPQINPSYIVPNPYAYNFAPSNGWNYNTCGCSA